MCILFWGLRMNATSSCIRATTQALNYTRIEKEPKRLKKQVKLRSTLTPQKLVGGGGRWRWYVELLKVYTRTSIARSAKNTFEYR